MKTPPEMMKTSGLRMKTTADISLYIYTRLVHCTSIPEVNARIAVTGYRFIGWLYIRYVKGREQQLIVRTGGKTQLDPTNHHAPVGPGQMIQLQSQIRHLHYLPSQTGKCSQYALRR